MFFSRMKTTDLEFRQRDFRLAATMKAVCVEKFEQTNIHGWSQCQIIQKEKKL